MKSRKEVEKKLVQVRYRHLKKALRTGLSRKPENCQHNAKLGQGSKPDAPRVGICMLGVDQGENPKGVCDECFGGQNRAADCADFEARQDAADIRSDFDTFLRSASKGEIAYHYPDMAALLWALGDHPSLDSILPDDDVQMEPEAEATDECSDVLEVAPGTHMTTYNPWWVRVWVWVKERISG